MDKKAFTLIEVLIVVVLVAIMGAISMPSLVKTLERAKMNEALTNLDFIRSGQKRYFSANGTFTLDMDSLPIENPNSTAARYYDYTIQSSSSSNFTARAARKSNAPSGYRYYYEIDKSGSITSDDPSFN